MRGDLQSFEGFPWDSRYFLAAQGWALNQYTLRKLNKWIPNMGWKKSLFGIHSSNFRGVVSSFQAIEFDSIQPLFAVFFFAQHCVRNIFIALHQAPLNSVEYVGLMHDGRKMKLLNQRNSWKRVFLALALPVLQCQIKKLAMIGMHVSTSWTLKKTWKNNTIWKWFVWDEATPTPWRSKIHGRSKKKRQIKYWWSKVWDRPPIHQKQNAPYTPWK